MGDYYYRKNIRECFERVLRFNPIINGEKIVNKKIVNRIFTCLYINVERLIRESKLLEAKKLIENAKTIIKKTGYNKININSAELGVVLLILYKLDIILDTIDRINSSDENYDWMLQEIEDKMCIYNGSKNLFDKFNDLKICTYFLIYKNFRVFKNLFKNIFHSKKKITWYFYIYWDPIFVAVNIGVYDEKLFEDLFLLEKRGYNSEVEMFLDYGNIKKEYEKFKTKNFLSTVFIEDLDIEVNDLWNGYW